ncbi:MAG: hypothetical protein PHD95_02835 [Candidatus ainarchaeum sp.]|nr:hypothetical protein [Candidatus ainarchaeum sp.]
MKIQPKEKMVFFAVLLILMIAITGCVGGDAKTLENGCNQLEATFGNTDGVTEAKTCVPPQGSLLSDLVAFSGQGDSTKTAFVEATCTYNTWPASWFAKWQIPIVTVNSCTDGCIVKTDGGAVCAENFTAT